MMFEINLNRSTSMKKQVSYWQSAAGLGLFAILLWSCYPSSPSNVYELDLVLTFNDTQFNFGNIRTYALPETVFVLEGSTEVHREFDDLILSEVDKNMTNLGYTREPNPEQNGADIVVVVSISRQNRTYTDFSWYPYWGSWPGWSYWGAWDAGWGLYYPWKQNVIFADGSIFIEMIDPNARGSHGDKLPVRWGGVINGILSTNVTATSDQVTGSIDRCFAQSPYLGR
jgi:hypothetical protein